MANEADLEHVEPAKPIWIFLDESGNFDFSERGTKFFVMTAIVTCDPVLSGSEILALKYEQMLRGSQQLDFHASHNSKGTRARVLETIGSIRAITSLTVVFEKNSLASDYRSSNSLMVLAAKVIFGFLKKGIENEHHQVTVTFDSVLGKNAQSDITGATKKTLSPHRTRVYFHRVANDPNGQIADFIAWAHHRFVTVNDDEGTKFLPADTHKLVYFDHNGRT